MRTLVMSTLATALVAGLAQGQSLQEKYDAKLKESWLVDGGWTTDFAAAKARAKKENKLVFAYFSRSYSP